MLYIALALTTILTAIFGIAHEEQKHIASQYKARVQKLENENAKLRAKTMTPEEWDRMTDHVFATIH